MKPFREKLFFSIRPEFPDGRKWIVEARDYNNQIRAVVICENKLGLLDALEQALPDDDGSIDANFEKN